MMRIVSATDALRGEGLRSARGSVKRTRVPGRPSGRSMTSSRPPCASTSRRQMYRPSPVPGIRDSRTFQARWNGSVTRPRSASGMPTPASSTVTASHGPRPRHRSRSGCRPVRTCGRSRRGSTAPGRRAPTSTSSGGRSAGGRRRAARRRPRHRARRAIARRSTRTSWAPAPGSAGRPARWVTSSTWSTSATGARSPRRCVRRSGAAASGSSSRCSSVSA